MKLDEEILIDLDDKSFKDMLFPNSKENPKTGVEKPLEFVDKTEDQLFEELSKLTPGAKSFE